MARCAREVESCERPAGDDGDELDHVPLIRRRESARKCKGKLSMLTEERLSCVNGVVAVKEEEEQRFAQATSLLPIVGPGDSYQESGGNSSAGLHFANNMKDEIPDDTWSDELDHIPLVTRWKMLLLKKHLPLTGSSETYLTEDSGRLVECSHDIVKEEALMPSLGMSEVAIVNTVIGEEKNKSVPICSANGRSSSLAKERSDVDIHGSRFLCSLNTVLCPSSEDVSSFSCHREGSPSVKTSDSLGFQQSDGTTSSSSKSNRFGEDGNVSVDMPGEPIDTSLLSAKLKIEPSDHHGTPCALYGFPFEGVPVKVELEISEGLQIDKLDDTRLQERMELLPAQLDFFKCAVPPFVHSLKSTLSDPPTFPIMASKRSRKRKKTATDSVETAMEEDVPGLLQVLLNEGISVDDIKLYGEPESDDLLNESCGSNDFAGLEEVISKLFTQRQSDSKFGLFKSSQDSKTSYCLACLFSLVEQPSDYLISFLMESSGWEDVGQSLAALCQQNIFKTRFLRVRKWPVEWGWCRDLQSFIFVFERHKRIVLERPEYGYATYFFELVDRLPIDWQIKRLMTAMKLTTYSRLTLLENRPLLIGEDLTEWEAKVLMEYGWIPSTGLATMLNYCDRVVHDRKNEKNTSEWRVKIGKLLMDGYNGGTIVLSEIPKKAMEHLGLDIKQVKMEEPE